MNTHGNRKQNKELQQTRIQAKQQIKGKRFQFSNCSGRLAKQHSADEFHFLIETKKNYQSLIKEQLQKLEKMEGQIADPEIQDFVIGKNQTIIVNSARTAKKKIVNEDDLYAEEYFNRQVDQNSIDSLNQKRKKYYSSCFVHLLKAHLKYSKNNKAVNFYRDEFLQKKCFQILKNESIGNSSLNQLVQERIFILEKYIKANNMRIMINSIKGYIAQRKHLNLVESKRIKSKKSTLVSLKKQFNKIKQLQIKAQKLRKHRQKDVAEFLTSRYENNYVFLSNIHKLTILRKRKSFGEFKKNSIFQISMKNKKIQDIINNLGQQTKDLKDIEKQAKKLGWDSVLTQFVQVRTSLINKQKQIKEKIIKNHRQDFLRELNFGVKQQRLIELQQNKINLSKQKIFFEKLKQFQLFCQKKNKFSQYLLSRKWSSFVQNSSSDIKFRKCIGKCLNGSKEWLIKNKYIFQAFPKTNNQQSQQEEDENEELLDKFQHPLSGHSEMKLLETQSKFKKCLTRFLKISALRRLSSLRDNKKRSILSVHHMSSWKKNATLKKVFSILKDTEKIKQIYEQIGQEQSDSTQNQQKNLIQEIIQKFSKIRFIRRLESSRQLMRNDNKIKQIFEKHTKLSVFSQLKNNHKQNKKTVQLKQKVRNYCTHIFELNANHLFVVLKQNAKHSKKDQQLQKQKIGNFQLVTNDQALQSKYGYERQISSVKKIIQRVFFKFLSMNFCISTNSVKVTSMYFNKQFKNFVTNMKIIEENNKILIQNQEKSNKLTKIKKSNWMKMFLQRTSSQKFNKLQIDKVKQLIDQLSIRKSLKKIKEYSLFFRTLAQKTKESQIYLNLSDKRSFFVILKKLYLKNQKKKAQKINVQQNQNQQFTSQQKKGQQSSQKESNENKNNLEQFISQENDLPSSVSEVDKNNSVQNIEDRVTNLQQYLDDSYGSQLFQSDKKNKENISHENNSSGLFESPEKNQPKYHDDDEHEEEDDVSIEYQDGKYYPKKQNQQNHTQFIHHKEENTSTKKQNQQKLNETEQRQAEQIVNENSDDDFQKYLSQYNGKINENNSQCSENNQSQKENEQNNENNENENLQNDQSTDAFQLQYAVNKYQNFLIKKCFNSLKKAQNQKKQNIEIMSLVFQGLKMYTSKRKMVKQYLSQLEKQTHYYPQNADEYRQFEELSHNF